MIQLWRQVANGFDRFFRVYLAHYEHMYVVIETTKAAAPQRTPHYVSELPGRRPRVNTTLEWCRSGALFFFGWLWARDPLGLDCFLFLLFLYSVRWAVMATYCIGYQANASGAAPDPRGLPALMWKIWSRRSITSSDNLSSEARSSPSKWAKVRTPTMAE